MDGFGHKQAKIDHLDNTNQVENSSLVWLVEDINHESNRSTGAPGYNNPISNSCSSLRENSSSHINILPAVPFSLHIADACVGIPLLSPANGVHNNDNNGTIHYNSNISQYSSPQHAVFAVLNPILEERNTPNQHVSNQHVSNQLTSNSILPTTSNQHLFLENSSSSVVQPSLHQSYESTPPVVKNEIDNASNSSTANLPSNNEIHHKKTSTPFIKDENPRYENYKLQPPGHGPVYAPSQATPDLAHPPLPSTSTATTLPHGRSSESSYNPRYSSITDRENEEELRSTLPRQELRDRAMPPYNAEESLDRVAPSAILPYISSHQDNSPYPGDRHDCNDKDNQHHHNSHNNHLNQHNSQHHNIAHIPADLSLPGLVPFSSPSVSNAPSSSSLSSRSRSSSSSTKLVSGNTSITTHRQQSHTARSCHHDHRHHHHSNCSSHSHHHPHPSPRSPTQQQVPSTRHYDEYTHNNRGYADPSALTTSTGIPGLSTTTIATSNQQSTHLLPFNNSFVYDNNNSSNTFEILHTTNQNVNVNKKRPRQQEDVSQNNNSIVNDDNDNTTQPYIKNEYSYNQHSIPVVLPPPNSYHNSTTRRNNHLCNNHHSSSHITINHHTISHNNHNHNHSDTTSYNQHQHTPSYNQCQQQQQHDANQSLSSSSFWYQHGKNTSSSSSSRTLSSPHHDQNGHNIPHLNFPVHTHNTVVSPHNLHPSTETTTTTHIPAVEPHHNTHQDSIIPKHELDATTPSISYQEYQPVSIKEENTTRHQHYDTTTSYHHDTTRNMSHIPHDNSNSNNIYNNPNSYHQSSYVQDNNTTYHHDTPTMTTTTYHPMTTTTYHPPPQGVYSTNNNNNNSNPLEYDAYNDQNIPPLIPMNGDHTIRQQQQQHSPTIETHPPQPRGKLMGHYSSSSTYNYNNGLYNEDYNHYNDIDGNLYQSGNITNSNSGDNQNNSINNGYYPYINDPNTHNGLYEYDNNMNYHNNPHGLYNNGYYNPMYNNNGEYIHNNGNDEIEYDDEDDIDNNNDEEDYGDDDDHDDDNTNNKLYKYKKGNNNNSKQQTTARHSHGTRFASALANGLTPPPAPTRGASQGRYTCHVCHKGFNTRVAVQRHLKRHRTSDYMCKDCNRSFVRATDLSRHMKLHSSNRPWGCSFCTKRFTTRANCRVHERCHTGIKPYQCNQCGVCFAQISARNNHIRTHTNEKPYICLCGKAFGQAATLKAHLDRKLSVECAAFRTD